MEYVRKVRANKGKGVEDMDTFNEKNSFYVLDGYGVNTLAFEVLTSIEEGQEVCSIEKMNSFMERAENGFKKTFFFKDMAAEERKELVFVRLKAGEAELNTAEFVNGKLNLSPKPGTIQYSSLKTAGSEAEYKEFKYTPNFKRPISIIDPAICDEVKPILYWDTEVNDLRGKIKLLPNKSYIAIEIKKE